MRELSIKRFDQFKNSILENTKEECLGDAIENQIDLGNHINKEKEITKSEINDEIASLMRKDMDKKKHGTQLKKRDATPHKRLNISRNLIKMDEDSKETENYMFFANLSNIKRMCEEILEMEPSMVDSILKNGHGWAVDHIATSKDDVEEVFNFLKTETEGSHNKENGLISDNNEKY